MTTARKAVFTVALVTASMAAMPCISAAAELPTYTATYQVEYNGRRAGTSEFSVSYDDATGIYRFQSHTSARGLFRLVSPNTVVERSDFLYEDGQLRPLNFWFEDGSRRGSGNLHIGFDWEAGVATITGSSASHSVDLQPGVLDRGTMQVALMLDMTKNRPAEYLLPDDDELRSYRYAPSGEETVTSSLGRHETTVYQEQREGSSRVTLVWGSPELAYLPVRIERRRDGETQTALILESVQGLGNR